MVARWLSNRCFQTIHSRNLVYNTCWEDPRLDREALQLSDDDRVMVITSAGCNALDYALDGPAAVHAVDVNPLQNALLELKKAAIKTLDYEDFYQAFGRGQHPRWPKLYQSAVRSELPEFAREIWDRRLNFFDGSHGRQSFYYRGTSGWFAWLATGYLNRLGELREAIGELLDATSISDQEEIYQRRNVDELLWTRPLRWALRRDTTMAMLGVPRSQRNQIDQCYPGGLFGFIQDRITAVFRTIPLADNYFWRVYLTGQYTKTCCPEYLKPDQFQRLKDGLADRITTHTDTVETFLRTTEHRVSRYILLDHMDWLYDRYPQALASEWQAIVESATESAKVLWRSAAMTVDFVDPLKVSVNGRHRRVGDLLSYQDDQADRLHQLDRVRTYGSFKIADLNVNAA